MNELQKAIYKKVVEPAIRAVPRTTRATVLEYDGVHNICKIQFHLPFIDGMVEMDRVPVQIGSGGFHSAGPFEGDEVWVDFANGDYRRPQVVSLADRFNIFQTRENRLKHTKKGVYVVDSICARSSAPHDGGF